MNNQVPFGFNPNMQPMPMYPNQDFSPNYNQSYESLEKRISVLENKVKNLESKLNITNTDMNSYPYQSSMHMM